MKATCSSLYNVLSDIEVENADGFVVTSFPTLSAKGRGDKIDYGCLFGRCNLHEEVALISAIRKAVGGDVREAIQLVCRIEWKDFSGLRSQLRETMWGIALRQRIAIRIAVGEATYE